MTISIRDCGARGDGQASDTRAIQQAIDNATGHGGTGHVVVSPGTYLCGTVLLKSNLKLELLPGATLKAIDNKDEYPALPKHPHYPPKLSNGGNGPSHFMAAYDCANIIICGGGTIDGLQCSASCPKAQAGRGAVVVQNAEGFRLAGLTIRWPRKPPEEGFLPKYANGELVRDPRVQFEPMPPMHAVLLIDARAEVKDVHAEGFRGAEVISRP